MEKKLVLVVCGAGTLTSVIASQGVQEGLEKKGLAEGVEVKVGRLDDIERYKDRITVLVASMNIREKYDFPVINAISFLTGDEDGQQMVIDKVVGALNNL
ncbi:PTS sucrose transporter subunit IIABC [Faecalicoccus pleomorphus]|nr:PTS sucrose transporter subunit IIABC [Faecalicoccus pleomorphus]